MGQSGTHMCCSLHEHMREEKIVNVHCKWLDFPLQKVPASSEHGVPLHTGATIAFLNPMADVKAFVTFDLCQPDLNVIDLWC